LDFESKITAWTAALLILLAPLPLGSGEPWGVITVETVIFLLVLTWLLGMIVRKNSLTRQLPASLVLPCGLFLAVLLFQLTPLPPSMLKILSPNTYRLYSLSLRGWPQQRPYSLVLTNAQATREIQSQERATGGSVGKDGRSSTDTDAIFARPKSERRIDRGSWSSSVTWRRLSIAPSLSEPALLKILAYGSLLFLLLLCPVVKSDGDQAGTTFRLIIVIAIVLSGFVVAALGIIEFFTWNGKILWVFEPYDWRGVPPLATLRASGPFVNPDHFGNYLAMVLPIAAGGAFVDFGLVPERLKREFRLFSGLCAFIILAALLLSLSRGAWTAAAIGLGVLVLLADKVPADARSGLLSGQHHFLRNACIGTVGIFAIALALIGPRGRTQVDIRLAHTTPADDSFRQRLRMASDTLHIVHDYPLFGVGLASWPEIFPRYRRPPWSYVGFRETHNDYAQLLSETGVFGFACLIWFVALCVKHIRHTLRKNPGYVGTPVVVALCGGLVAMMFQELCDFAFHMPANALLVTVLLALALQSEDSKLNARRSGSAVRLYAVCGVLGTLALIVVAFHQDTIPYPYNLKNAETVADARALILAHPAEASPHLQLIALDTEGSNEDLQSELQIASWLDPTNPNIMDLYAASLAQSEQKSRALAALTQSIENSPSLATHVYLRTPVVAELTESESAAIELGFRQAIARKYNGSAKGFADYYEVRQQFAYAAKQYLAAATEDCGDDRRPNCVLYAGKAYAQAGDYVKAESVLRGAIAENPTESECYRYLIAFVLGPERRFKVAKTLMSEAITVGTNPISLYMALAEAEYTARDLPSAEKSLSGAVAVEPSFEAFVRLGQIYLEDQKYDLAASAIRQATEMEPSSADAYFNLGIAEERSYDYVKAEEDFEHAVKLAPTKASYTTYYRNFEHRLAADVKMGRPAQE